MWTRDAGGTKGGTKSLVTTTTSVLSGRRDFGRITSIHLPFLDRFEIRELEIWLLPRPIRPIAEWSQPE